MTVVSPTRNRDDSNDDMPAVRFPIRAAALDVGSNAIRYSIAEFSDPQHFVEIDTQRFSVRLGRDAFTTGVLGEQSLHDAVMAAAVFRRRLEEFGVTRYRAVATSAVRESRNGRELVRRFSDECGLDLETISGSEEARLVWVAVSHRVRMTDGPWVLADLGGGSVEVSIVDNDAILASESQPLGTVRMIEDLPSEDDSPVEFRNLLRGYASRVTLPGPLPRPAAGTILTGGSAESLADLICPGATPGIVVDCTRADLRGVMEKLSGMTIRDRIRKLGLRPDRADVIIPAGVVYDRVAELAGSDRLIVPRVGVKDGLLLDLAIAYAEHRRHEGELDRLTRAGALALGERHHFDEKHAQHVATLALSIFDQLGELHGLGQLSRRRLETATLLHDIGQVIAYRRHHKHSWYIIRHAELPGLTAGDVRLVALITRYHRRSEPKDYHEDYSGLREVEKLEVQKLSAILRVADALDHDHSARVQSIDAKVTKKEVLLRLTPREDTAVEEWALKKKAGLFEKVYDRKMGIV